MAPRKFIAFTPRRTVLFISGVALLIILGYSAYAALPLIQGPSLTATATIDTDAVLISGMTRRVAFLEVNGAPVPLQENGSFLAKRAYPPGYTAITVTARDRFGKGVTKKLSLLSPKQEKPSNTKEEAPIN